jgi:hypothetical protein
VKVRLGLLREYLREALYRASANAPTDPDAAVPGHLPEELPPSAATDGIEEQAMVPGRWYGGEEPEGYDRERVGDPLGMDETDERFEDDALGNGEPDRNDPDADDFDIADHLRGDEEKTSLGDPPDETMEESAVLEDLDEESFNALAAEAFNDGDGFMGRRVSLADDIRRFFLQENPAGAGMVDPLEPPMGAYSDFDMTKDHTGTDDLSATWYRSPGREPGGDGDPFRGPDPHAQLGFHPPKAQDDPVASPPAADGEEGVAARLAPPIWQLSAGGNTGEVLGANAKDPASGVGSEGEPEEGEEGEGAEGELESEKGTSEEQG